MSVASHCQPFHVAIAKRGELYIAAKHKSSLSLEKNCSTKRGYLPKYNAAELCLAGKFAKQIFLLNSHMQLGHDFKKELLQKGSCL